MYELCENKADREKAKGLLKARNACSLRQFIEMAEVNPMINDVAVLLREACSEELSDRGKLIIDTFISGKDFNTAIYERQQGESKHKKTKKRVVKKPASEYSSDSE